MIDRTARAPLSQSSGHPEADPAPRGYHVGPPAQYVGPCGAERRAQLLDVSVGDVSACSHLHDDARCGVDDRGSTSRFLVVLPYRGLFILRAGHQEVVGDANQVLFATRGEDHRVTGPLPLGYGYLVVAPRQHVLSELSGAPELELSDHRLFRRRCWQASPALQTLRAHFLQRMTGAADVDDLEGSELVLSLLRESMAAELPPTTRFSPATARMIGRAKEFLEAELSMPIRLSDVSHAVGVSPTYLTDTFRRVEGTPLHRYLTHLRLARALAELPHTADLTTLALELGFSSHSHFTAAFRRRFGCTPSEFRSTTKRRPTRA
jgi:AraC family transcriptional regulator